MHQKGFTGGGFFNAFFLRGIDRRVCGVAAAFLDFNPDRGGIGRL
jgi:hypothetical protein